MKVKSGYKKIILCIATGLLAAAAFPKINLFFLMWIAFVPLIYVIMKTGYKGSFFYGFISGFVLNAVSIYWLTPTLQTISSYSQAVMISSVLWIYCSLYWGIWSMWVHFTKNTIAKKVEHDIDPNILLAFFSAAMWVVLEYIRTYLFTGFSWLILGYSQAEFTEIIQIAEFTGVYGVSFVLILCNFCFYFWIFSKKGNKYLYIALIFIVIIAIFGTVRSYKFKFFGDQEFTVFIVQPNIDQYKKWDADFRTEILDELKQYALAISKDKTDLVLWPETVLTGLVPMDRVSYSAAKDITNTAGGLNILGSPYNDEDDKEYNAVLMFENGEDHKAVHKKNCLVPFGEYFPYRSFFAWFCTAINKLGDFSRGTDAQVFDDGRICVGSMICSENFYPVMSRRFVLGGARVISSHTNDAWFYNTAALPQHFAMNVLRAVENRKAVLVAANSGISGIIESSGVIVSRTQTDQRALLRGTFFQNDFKTFYVKFKDLFAYICIGLILSVFIYSILLCKRGKTCLNNRKKEYMR